MIPLKDDIPSRTFPLITITLIVVNSIVFLYEVSLGNGLTAFISRYSIIPLRFFNPHYFREDVFSGVLVPLCTHMFLHGGWFHVMGNMLYLWIFGDNVEDRMGHLRYLVFYFLCGFASGVMQLFMFPSSQLPMIGASGAIAGVMGGYLLLYPYARVVTLFFFLFFVEVVRVPALFFLGFWFIIQFFSGSFSLSFDTAGGGVAWWAHIGGFLCGAFLVIPFRRRKQVRFMM
jgi:membrane associated rhomboid family serine protease